MPAHRNVSSRYFGSIPLLALWMLLATRPAFTRAEEGSSWWPFGGSDKSADSMPELSDTPREAPKPRGNPRPRVGTMPMSQRNSSWLGKGWPWGKKETQPNAAPKQGAMSSARSAGQSVSKATSSAWDNTFGKLKWGGSSASREAQNAQRERQIRQQQQQAAKQQQQPGFFARLFGGEKKEPEGPRTVTEWMAQERPGMNK